MMRAIIFLMIISTSLFAQSFSSTEYTWGDAKEWSYYINDVDSGTTSGDILGSVSSNPDFTNFNDDFANYPLGYWLDITDADTTVIIKIEIQGSFTGGSWTVVDTVLAADTLNSNHAGFTDLSGVLDLNYASYKYPEYRPMITITSASSATCDVLFNIFAYKRD